MESSLLVWNSGIEVSTINARSFASSFSVFVHRRLPPCWKYHPVHPQKRSADAGDSMSRLHCSFIFLPHTPHDLLTTSANALAVMMWMLSSSMTTC